MIMKFLVPTAEYNVIKPFSTNKLSKAKKKKKQVGPIKAEICVYWS